MTRHLDTGTDDLLAHIDGHVGVLTFNRPDRRNALSDAMYAAFPRILPHFATDDDVRVVMLTGSGEAFCAGGDVKGMHESHQPGAAPRRGTDTESSSDVLNRLHRQVTLALHRHPKPVIAALPGAAAGAGMSIALACDLRLAAERAIVVPAFINVGASGDFGGSWFLTKIVGTAKAKELYFTSPRLSAADARELGIVNVVLPDDDFAANALAWCQSLGERAPLALRAMKRNLNLALTCDVETALEAEAANMSRSLATEDHREAAAAFVEKRPPRFVGR